MNTAFYFWISRLYPLVELRCLFLFIWWQIFEECKVILIFLCSCRCAIIALITSIISKFTHIEGHHTETLSHHFNIISFANLPCISGLKSLTLKSLPMLVWNSPKDTLIRVCLLDLTCCLRKNQCVIVVSIDNFSVTLLNWAPVFYWRERWRIIIVLENKNVADVINVLNYLWPCSSIFDSKWAINLWAVSSLSRLRDTSNHKGFRCEISSWMIYATIVLRKVCISKSWNRMLLRTLH